MKNPMQFLIFMILFHAFLAIFTIAGFMDASSISGVNEWEQAETVSMLDLIFQNATAIGITGGIAGFTGIVSTFAGGDPYRGLGFGIIAGIVVGTWISLFETFGDIASMLGEYAWVVTAIGTIIGTIFTWSIINAIMQMSSPAYYDR